MTNDIPQHFDRAFLRWFQKQTEEAWQTYPTKTFESYVTAGAGGSDWQQGTRWLGGLDEQEIVSIEQRYQVRFPPDYRLFLHMLHSVDRPMVSARFQGGTILKNFEQSTLIPSTAPSFYNWQTDTTSLQAAWEWLVDGLVFDVQRNDLWLPGWGVKPEVEEAQEARVRELVHAAPRLIPVVGHRYLLAEPCGAGNTVFSIYQSDMIIYGENLYSYFLHEFGDLLGIAKPPDGREKQLSLEPYRAIPFWGEILCGEF